MNNLSHVCGSSVRNRVKSWLFTAIAIVTFAVCALPARAGDDRAVKSKTAPIYPEVAKRLRIQGEVKVEAVVDSEGKVKDVKGVSGNQVLSVAAQEAVKHWRFEPGDGDATVVVALNFQL